MAVQASEISLERNLSYKLSLLTFFMSKAFGRLLVDQGRGGSIVNISSIGGKIMPARTTAYAASKAAIHALTCGMATEVGPSGVRVNAVCPGIILTDRTNTLPAPILEAFTARLPLPRGGAPSEAAEAYIYAMRAGYNSAAHGGAYASLAAAICADDAHAMDVYDGDATHCAADAANSAAQAAEFAARPGYRARASEESVQRQADKLIEVIARAHTAKP